MSETLARAKTAEFILAKRQQLKRAGAELASVNEVIRKLRRTYQRLEVEFLRTQGTTYATWLELGPKGEWEEVLEATRDSSVWDRLVATYDKREAKAHA